MTRTSTQSVGLALLILVICAGVVGILHAEFYSWPRTVLNIRKAKAELHKAWGVNDLDVSRDYLTRALNYLDSYSGNPQWWYPTPQTDWDRIKEVLISIINQIENLGESPGSYAYQQMIHNLGEYQIPEILLQINETQEWMTVKSPTSLVILLIWAFLFVVSLTLSQIWKF